MKGVLGKGKKSILLFIALLLLSTLPLVNLLTPGLPITHDGLDHVARIANFYDSLKEGILIPRWAANLNWGYGHPILMFLYPLPSYSASIFHFLSFSYVDSLKIVFALSFVLSIFTMFVWAKEAFGEIPGFFTALLYSFAPYRFVDFYVRGAIGEHVAFIFPPLIFYSLLKYSKSSKYRYLFILSLSTAGLILAHNAISIIFLPWIVLYVFYLWWAYSKKTSFIFNAFAGIILGFLYSAFFLVPAFLEGKYTLRDIVTAGEYTKRFVDPLALLYGPWDYRGSGFFTVQIGTVQLLLMGILLFVFFKIRDIKKRGFYIGLIIMTVIPIFLMLPQSEFIWQKVTTLQKFQFPWRFLSVVVFSTAAAGGSVVSSLKNKKLQISFVLILALALLFIQKDYWHGLYYKEYNDSFFEKIYNGTTDTGESAPIWSIRFMEKEPKAFTEIIDGRGSIKNVARKTTVHDYQVDAVGLIRVRENTLYFPGWKVFVDGKSVPVEFQDQLNRGLITYYVPDGKHFVRIIFTDTKLRTLSNILTIVSFALGMIMLFIALKLKKF